MSSERIIKLSVADSEGVDVVILVTAKKDDLNLDLLATDGDSAFKGKIRERNCVKLKAKNYDGSDDEWKATLKYAFVSKQTANLRDTLKNNLELSCSRSGKDPKATLTINFRTRVEEITQRLGAVELPQTEDIDGVDLFGWASQLVDERDGLEKALQKEKMAATVATESIASLQTQLADLIKAKEQHENDLIEKFAELLNEKKMELRRRARQLSTAKMDPKRVEELEEEQGSHRKPRTSRGRKRAADQIEGEDSESDAFEDRMDVDNDQDADEERERDQSRSTGRQSDTDPAEDDDLDQIVTSQTEAGDTTSSRPSAKPKEPETMPPRRDLPFTQIIKEQQKQSLPKPQTPDDEETASEDDEL